MIIAWRQIISVISMDYRDATCVSHDSPSCVDNTCNTWSVLQGEWCCRHCSYLHSQTYLYRHTCTPLKADGIVQHCAITDVITRNPDIFPTFPSDKEDLQGERPGGEISYTRYYRPNSTSLLFGSADVVRRQRQRLVEDMALNGGVRVWYNVGSLW